MAYVVYISIYISLAAWATGVVIFIIRLWLLFIQLLPHRLPAVSLWDRLGGGGMFDSSKYTATGQIIHQKLMHLYGRTIVFGLGGVLLIAGIGSIAARFTGPP